MCCLHCRWSFFSLNGLGKYSIRCGQLYISRFILRFVSHASRLCLLLFLILALLPSLFALHVISDRVRNVLGFIAVINLCRYFFALVLYFNLFRRIPHGVIFIITFETGVFGRHNPDPLDLTYLFMMFFSLKCEVISFIDSSRFFCFTVFLSQLSLFLHIFKWLFIYIWYLTFVCSARGLLCASTVCDRRRTTHTESH